MLKSIKKLILIGTSGLISTGVVVPTTCTIVTNNNNASNLHYQNGSDIYSFFLKSANGNEIGFNSLNHALNSILGNSGTTINYETYIGDFHNATNSNNQVNVNRLKKYDPSKIVSAYKTANGSYVTDIQSATRSYLDNYRYKWMDVNGDIYNLETDAEISNREYANGQAYGVSFYNIYDNDFRKTYKINPLNKTDIDFFKKIAIRNLGYEDSKFSINKLQKSSVDNSYTSFTNLYSSSNATYDGYINSLYEIFKSFSEVYNNTNYDMVISLNNSIARLSTEYIWVKIVNGHVLGRDYYSKKYTPRQESIRYENAHYEIYDNSSRSVVSNISMSDLSAEQFVENGNYFHSKEKFLSSSKTSKNYIKVKAGNDQYGSKIYNEDCLGEEYKLTFNNKVYDFRINSSALTPQYNFKEVMTIYADSYGSNTHKTTFNLDLTKEISDEQKSSLISSIKNTLVTTLVGDILSFSDYIPESVRESIESKCNETANAIVNLFVSILDNYRVPSNVDLSTIIEDVNNHLGDKKTTSERYQALSSVANNWWVKRLFENSGFLDQIQTLRNDIVSLLNSHASVDSYFINYNNVPVFMIENVSSFIPSINNSTSITDVADALLDWMNSSSYDASKLVNISNKIQYINEINYFSTSQDYPSQTRYLEDDTNTLRKIQYSDDYTLEELTRYQHLLLSSDDKIEESLNDTGIESSIYLYNKNIDTIRNLSNADQYIEKINADDIANTDVLRLYESVSITNGGDVLYEPEPVAYGKVRSKVGLFNPSLYKKSVIYYEDQLDSIVTLVKPVSVATVDINGTTYLLSEIANLNSSVVVGGDINDLLNNAAYTVMNYIKPSTEYVYYVDDNDIDLITNEIDTVCHVSLDVGNLSKSIFTSSDYYFTSYQDAIKYMSTVLQLNGSYR